ncbi:putative phospholipid-transporting ATPase IH [Schistosoma japonicum]|nr:putative phospholipid-transporting ATPase IH [Schistosoma japonicum]
MDQSNEENVNSSNIIGTPPESTPTSSLSRTVYAHRIQCYSPLTFTYINEYCNNEVVTSIYTIWNFLPKMIYEQLHYMSNIFFILVGILHLFADGATSIFSLIGPFSFVLLVTLLKDAIFDIMRHRQDKQINERKFPIMQINIETKQIYWKLTKSHLIHVGDVILCRIDEEFPCDLIILATSSKDCTCRITTVNLDGESTIKTQYSLLQTQIIYEYYFNDTHTYTFNNQFEDQLRLLFIKMHCQQPNEDFTHFDGYMTLLHNPCKQPLTLRNILYKGAKLKGTKWIIGLVVYTGNDTKLLLNSKTVKRKYSSRESKANEILLTFMIVMLGLCILFSIVTKIWSFNNLSNPFIPFENFEYWTQVKGVFRFLFILNYLIPISLIITSEIQQIIAAYFVSSDINLYDKEQDISTKSNTPQLVDELGQVKYLFSDKTGTLTQNEMNLHMMTVLNTNKVYVFNKDKLTNKHIRLKQIVKRMNKFGYIGVVYEKLDDLPNEYMGDSPEFSSSSDSELDENNDYCHDVNQQHFTLDTITKFRHVNHRISYQYSNQLSVNQQLPNELLDCLTILALCHTVETSENDTDKQTTTNKTGYMDNFYQAASPDEKALVIGAAKLGVIFMGSSISENNSQSRIYRIEYEQCFENGYYEYECLEYSIDLVLEFDSFRKRMTVMAKHPDGTYHIHSKGAESSIFKISNSSEGDVRRLANQHVTQFAINGLRTLVYATRQVDSEEYHALLNEYHHATSLFGTERSDALKTIYEKIESNLTLISITGVEDKLQPQVQECLKSLRNAGIHVWVLTGDKEETAITVSRAAGHFSPNMKLIHLTNCEDFLGFAYQLFKHLENLKMCRRKKKLRKRMELFFKEPINLLKVKANLKSKTTEEDIFKEQNKLNAKNNLFEKIKQLFGNRISLHIDMDQSRHRHTKRPGATGEPMALVIDGKSLRYALHPSLQKPFLDLCFHLTTVLCCRMTPLQKASVVQLVRSGFSEFVDSPITAAIGDGGNDVAMLLQANIGIGIFGKEGKEAVRVSDYAIPQFKHLQRLLLVHGHRANYRICLTMNLFYYKCVAFVTTQVLYTFYSGFSAAATFETVLFSIYNLTVTSIMCLIFGLFEHHLPDDILNENPYLYRKLKHQANLRAWYIWLWIFDGIWHGFIIFYGTSYFLTGGNYFTESTFYDSYGNVQQLFEKSLYGCATYVFLWLSVSLRTVIATRDCNIIVFGGFLATLIVNIAILIALQSTTTRDNINFRSYTKLCRSPTFWFALPLILITANIPSLLWRIFSDTWWNLQIQLSNIPNSRIRRKYRRSPTVWLRALTTDYLGNSSDILHGNGMKQDTS